ncbi:MAG: hypothetical protein FWC27_02350 [Firmicutes bacterium]|nr:hypothetical protein [Bacillota bacterium]
MAMLLAAALASCVPGEAGGAVDGLTEEFKQFLEIRGAQAEKSYSREEDGVVYSLSAGVLRVCDEAGEIWRSEESWYAEDFRLGDVDGDGNADVLFSLWKSYSFGPYHPARMENDDASVRCHLFLYTLRAGRMKKLWGSSNLPRPIYGFELSMDGERTPVNSGAVLRAVEGEYTADFSRTEEREYVYVWRGWGFVNA